MDYRSIRRRVAAGTGLVTALGLLPIATSPAVAAQPAADATIGESVISTLVAAAGSVAIADDSSTTGCMLTDPQPVAYRTDQIVLSTWLGPVAATAKVRAALNHLGTPAEITGVETITMNDIPGVGDVTPVVSVSFQAPPEKPVPIVSLARRLRDDGVEGAPNYLLAPSSGPSEFWPDGFPRPTTAPAPGRAPAIGTGVSIVVYDTGLASPTESNNPPNVTRLAPADFEALDAQEPYGVVDLPSSGHATAISGVIATIAPGATVEAARITDTDGVATDVSAARRMANTLRRANQAGSWPDLIVNAFGSGVCDAGPGRPDADMPPLGLRMVTEAVDRHDEAMIVVSAGNRSTSRPFYPAAFPTVIAIGALDTTGDSDVSAWTSASRSGPKADFSNWGLWVDAWAAGVDLATTHVIGYRFEPTGPVIDGLALVNGTSYAAPYVAALIAEQMATTGQSAHLAWAAILKSGVRCSAAIGSGVAVTLTTLNSAATAPPAPAAPPAC